MRIFQHLTVTYIRVGVFLALFFGAVTVLALGFQLGGYSNPELANFCYVLALVLFVGSFVAFFRAKSQSSSELEVQQKYRTVKVLLGNALAEGRAQQWGINYSEAGRLPRIADREDRHNWVFHTYKLIEEGLDKGRAEWFRGNKNDRHDARLKRLEELSAQITRADVNPDFDPQDWIN